MNRKIVLSMIGLGLIVGLAALAQNQGGQQQAQAQQPVPSQPPGAVAGMALSATTGEPLRKASLALQPTGNGGGSATATTTDNSGNFRFEAVDPGTYRLTGSRTGYVAGTYGQDKPGDQPKQLSVISGGTANGIQFKLVPQSVIIGKVFDTDGDPVQNAVVQVLHYSYPRGDRQLTTVQTGTTNDIGEFRIAGLSPGRYYVSATGSALVNNFLNQRGGGAGGGGGNAGGGGGNRGGNRGGNNGNNNAANNANNGRGRGRGAQAPKQQESDQQQENYVVTYYPRSLEPGSANPIDLVPGSEARGVDIGLAKQRQYRILGNVEGAVLSTPQANANDKNGKGKGKGGPGGQGVQVSLVPRGTQPGLNIQNLTGGANATVDPATGRFEFRSVSPGSYYIVAQSRGPANNQDRLTGRLPVDVGASNLDNMTVRMTNPLTVNGTLKLVTPDSTVNMKNVRVAFTPQTNVGGGGGRGGGGNGRIDMAADGTFTTQLDADAYSVAVTGVPDGYYLKAVKLSSQEVPDAVVNLNFSGAPLEIVLDTGAGTITGNVVNVKGDSPGRVLVTAVPVSGSRRTDLNKSTNSADDGSFKITNLPPGKYKLFAWEQIDQNSWMAPEFRAPFETLGTTAEVSTTSSSPVVLRMIGADQTAGK